MWPLPQGAPSVKLPSMWKRATILSSAGRGFIRVQTSNGLEHEHLEGLEFEGVRLAGAEFGRRGLCVLFPRAVHAPGTPCAGGKFEPTRGVAAEGRGLVAGIAQDEDAFDRRPRGPAVNLAIVGIAADPMGVDKDAGISLRPSGGFGEVVPVLLIEEAGGQVKFLDLGAAAEEFADFIGEILVVGGIARGSHPAVDDAVEHE